MKYTIAPFLQYYKDKWDDIWEKEEYKWRAIDTFQKNWKRISDDKENLHVVLKDAFKHTYNLFYFAQLDSLLSNALYAASDIRKALNTLFDESRDLDERVSEYREKFREITERNNKAGCFQGKTKSSRQDDRTISVYLSLRYPDKYYIYMKKIFVASALQLGYNDCYKRLFTDEITNLHKFNRFCDEVKLHIVRDKELLDIYNKYLQDNCINDYSRNNLLTQTFLYSICEHINLEHQYCKPIVLDSSKIKPSSRPTIEFKKFSSDTNYIREVKEQALLGLLGEQFVISNENKRLKDLRCDVCCIHKSKEKGGDGYGYDILSYEDDGKTLRYIEVKTTSSGFSTPFYMSHREMEFSRQHKDNYYIYRVYNYNATKKSGNIAIIKGDVAEYGSYPVQYRIAIKSDEL